MPPRSARRSSTTPSREVARALETAVESLVLAPAGDDDAASRHIRVAAAALALADAADRLAREEILVARDVDDATWEQVGEALGISKQGAFERFRTGPDGMHSRLFMKKAAQTSSVGAASDTSRGARSAKARKDSTTRS
jgi:hypothetical protein